MGQATVHLCDVLHPGKPLAQEALTEYGEAIGIARAQHPECPLDGRTLGVEPGVTLEPVHKASSHMLGRVEDRDISGKRSTNRW